MKLGTLRTIFRHRLVRLNLFGRISLPRNNEGCGEAAKSEQNMRQFASKEAILGPPPLSNEQPSLLNPRVTVGEARTFSVCWLCICGHTFLDAHAAFLHRDGTVQHSIKPVPVAPEALDVIFPAAEPIPFFRKSVMVMGGTA